MTMPLLPGSSRAIIGENIREMRASGHPEDQAVAAALRNAGVPRKKKKAKKAMKSPPKEK